MQLLTQLKPKAMGIYSADTAYPANSLVTSRNGATAYLSVQDAPAGTPLTNTDYFIVHTDLSAVSEVALTAREDLIEVLQNITEPVEASGDPVQMNDLLGGMPFDRVAMTLKAVQDGEGDASPSNIRAITGRTGAELTRSGKNLYTGSPNFDSSWGNYNLYTLVDETYLGMPVLKRNGAWDGVYKSISVVEGHTYTFSLYAKASEEKTAYFYLSMPSETYDVVAKTVTLTTSWQRYEVTIMCTESGICKPRIETGTAGADIFISGFQLEIGDEATSYESYQGDSYTADFNQTIYGGVFDWTTGLLTLTHALRTLNGTEAFVLYNGRFVKSILDSTIANYETDVISSHYVYATSGDARIFIGMGSSKLEIYDANYSTADEFNAYLAAQYAAGTPVQIVYKLATPSTVQLTAREIRQLAGTNTLSGDGAVQAMGRKDFHKELLARIEALEAALAE